MTVTFRPFAPPAILQNPTNPVTGETLELTGGPFGEQNHVELMKGVTAIAERRGVSPMDLFTLVLGAIPPDVKVRVASDATFDGVADAYLDVATGELRIPESIATALRSYGPRATATPEAPQGGRVDAGCCACSDRGDARSGSTAQVDDHTLAVALSLIAHEGVHAQQLRTGAIDRGLDHARTMYAAGDVDGALMVLARDLELPSQRAQEATQVLLRAHPTASTYLTFGPDGSRLDDDTAARRIVDARRAELVATLVGEGADLAGRRLPGRRLPGRRLPGTLLE